MSPPIFLINLDDSTDRLEKSQKRLAQQGIEFERVSGVKGAELSEKEIAFSHSITPELDIVIHQKPMSGGAAAAITKSAAQRLLEATDKFGRPVDSDIQHFWEKNIKVLSLMPYPVAQDMDFTSTISVQSSKTKKYFWRRKWQQLKTSLKNKEETQSQIEKFKQSLANN